MFLQHLSTDFYRFTCLDHENHLQPTTVRRDIGPLVHRPPLHHHVPFPHSLHLAVVELQFDLTFDYDSVVETHGAVHDG